jgi:hypothetical protein
VNNRTTEKHPLHGIKMDIIHVGSLMWGSLTSVRSGACDTSQIQNMSEHACPSKLLRQPPTDGANDELRYQGILFIYFLNLGGFSCVPMKYGYAWRGLLDFLR